MDVLMRLKWALLNVGLYSKSTRHLFPTIILKFRWTIYSSDDMEKLLPSMETDLHLYEVLPISMKGS